MEKIINFTNVNLTEGNMRGIVIKASEVNAEWPVSLHLHETDGGEETLVSVWDGEQRIFNYDLEADQSF